MSTKQKVKCPECGYSPIWRNGFRWKWRAGQRTRVQAYQCPDCGHQFRGDSDGN